MTGDIILRQLVLSLQEIYGDLLDSIILYGSTARGTHTDDSDVDVAILLHPGATKEMRDGRAAPHKGNNRITVQSIHKLRHPEVAAAVCSTSWPLHGGTGPCPNRTG